MDKTMRYAILGILFFVIQSLGEAAAPTGRWSEEIDALTKREVPVAHSGGVVFLGSSSIRRWKTLSNDFEGLSCVNCGFGGSWLADSVTYFPKLVVPWHPSTIVVYAGENDLEDGRSTAQVVNDFDALCKEAHLALPNTRIIMVSIKPSPARWHLRKTIEETNKILAAHCAADKLCKFVDVYSKMLDAGVRPRADLFGSDQLHMNEAGYKLWTQVLNEVLRPATPGAAPASTAATASAVVATSATKAVSKAASPQPAKAAAGSTTGL